MNKGVSRQERYPVSLPVVTGFVKKDVKTGGKNG